MDGNGTSWLDVAGISHRVLVKLEFPKNMMEVKMTLIKTTLKEPRLFPKEGKCACNSFWGQMVWKTGTTLPLALKPFWGS